MKVRKKSFLQCEGHACALRSAEAKVTWTSCWPWGGSWRAEPCCAVQVGYAAGGLLLPSPVRRSHVWGPRLGWEEPAAQVDGTAAWQTLLRFTCVRTSWLAFTRWAGCHGGWASPWQQRPSGPSSPCRWPPTSSSSSPRWALTGPHRLPWQWPRCKGSSGVSLLGNHSNLQPVQVEALQAEISELAKRLRYEVSVRGRDRGWTDRQSRWGATRTRTRTGWFRFYQRGSTLGSDPGLLEQLIKVLFLPQI